jgi:hypothetical protein
MDQIRRIAEHEAAHAVMAILVGHVVHFVTIDPAMVAALIGDDIGAGSMNADGLTQTVVPKTMSDGLIEIAAAGLAWDLRHRSNRLKSWRASRGDFTEYSTGATWIDGLRFLTAVARAHRVLRRADVAAAVRSVADALQMPMQSMTGSLAGVTVRNIVQQHVPGAGEMPR